MLLTKTDNCGSMNVHEVTFVLKSDCLGRNYKDFFINVTLSCPGIYNVDYNNMLCIYVYIFIYYWQKILEDG